MPKEAEKKPAVRAEQPREPSRSATSEFGKHIEPYGVSEPLSAEEPQEQGEKKSRHRRRRRRKDRDKDRPGAEMKKTPAGSDLETPSDSDLIDISLEIADKTDSAIEQGPGEEKSETNHSKHRRSRRGSHKRRKTGSDSDRERGIDAKQSAPAGRAESAASSEEAPQEFAGEDEGIDEELEDRGQRGAKSGFRAIPTWEEAVGCIVTKNMETRPRRQGGGPSRSRSGAESHKRRRK